MKKNYKKLKSLALLLLIPLLGWSQPNITQTKVAPGIDGVEDGAWSVASWNAVTHITDGGTADPTWHGNFKLLWDKNNIYLFIKVDDAIKGINLDAANAVKQDQSDYADLFIGFKQNGNHPNGWNSYLKSDFQVNFLRGDATFGGIGGQTAIGGKRIANNALITRAVTDANGIWTVEASIPIKALYDTVMVVNDSIRVDLTIGNASTSVSLGTRDFRAAFNATADNSWDDPRIWAKAKLDAASATPLVITGYSENFNSALTASDSALWISGAPVTGTVENSKLHIKLVQNSFSDGKFYNFLGAKNASFNFQKPLMSFKLTVDSAHWDWVGAFQPGNAGKIPLSISSFIGTSTRLVQNSQLFRVGCVDSVVYFSLVKDGVDQSKVDEFLFESVSWPSANKAYYWIDDIKIGDQVVLPNPITAIALSTTENTDTIKTKAGKLHLVANLTPANATIKGIVWSVVPGTGYATIDASGVLTAVSDGTVQVVAKTTDGSNLTATKEIVMVNVYGTAVITYTELFNAAVNMNLWAPSGAMTGARKTFIVTQVANKLHVDMQQASFSDGQMYEFAKWTGKFWNLTANPYISLKLKIDSAKWLVPDWNQGGALVPSTTMPFAVSVWNNDVRLGGSDVRVAIDTVTKSLVFNMFAAGADLTKINKVLIETVDWPNANYAAFNIDDFKAGTAAAASVVKATAIDVQATGGVDTIKVNNASLQMVANFTPANTTFQGIAWSVIKGTGYASIDASGVLKGISDGDVKVVGVTTDGTNLKDTISIHLVNQYDVVKTYTETFTNPVDMNLWAPNPQIFTDSTRKSFVVSQTTALVIDMKQNGFADGQMYDFKTNLGKIFDLSAKPLASMKVKVDTSVWLAPDWNQGGALVPQTSMPFGVSAYSGDTRIGGSAVRVPIDKSNSVYYFTFVNPGADLTAITKFLIETVEWPAANVATFEIDDFKLGNAVVLPSTVTGITVNSPKDTIVNKLTTAGNVTLTVSILPVDATISSVYWSVNDTTIAKIDQTGKLTSKKGIFGTVTVTATAMDASGISGTKDIVIALNTDVQDMLAAGYTIYPNPVAKILSIKHATEIKNVYITNLTGQSVLNTQSPVHGIDVSSLSSGVYMIRITTIDGKSLMTKFIKQ